jgi:hypothetical protein
MSLATHWSYGGTAASCAIPTINQNQARCASGVQKSGRLVAARGARWRVPRAGTPMESYGRSFVICVAQLAYFERVPPQVLSPL